MKLSNLRVCNLNEPIGFAMEAPVFSWTVEESTGKQKWASLVICVKGEIVFKSGEVQDTDSLWGDG